MSDPKHIYIAGPMRGVPAYNFPSFFRVEGRLHHWYPGAEVVNPARMDAERFRLTHMLDHDPTGATIGALLMDGGEGFEFTPEDLRVALAEDLSYICLKADRIFMLPGWRVSRGACAEHAAALALGVRVSGARE